MLAIVVLLSLAPRETVHVDHFICHAPCFANAMKQSVLLCGLLTQIYTMTMIPY